MLNAMLLQIEERDLASGIRLVELKGKLALGRESQRVETLVDELAKTGRLRAIFDMTHVDYIDSAGIGMLALASGKMREAGGKLAIVAPEGRVLQLLKLTQIIAILSVSASVDDAVKTFGEAQSQASA
jgi:anti-sigma B factor antagonist